MIPNLGWEGPGTLWVDFTRLWMIYPGALGEGSGHCPRLQGELALPWSQQGAHTAPGGVPPELRGDPAGQARSCRGQAWAAELQKQQQMLPWQQSGLGALPPLLGMGQGAQPNLICSVWARSCCSATAAAPLTRLWGPFWELLPLVPIPCHHGHPGAAPAPMNCPPPSTTCKMHSF